MKKFLKRLGAGAMAAAMLFSLSSCTGRGSIEGLKSDESQKLAYSYTYKTLSATKTENTDTWRHGMVSGNGMQGVITSGSPYSDTLIFQNMHFIMPNRNTRSCPVTSDELETVKQSIVKGENITDDASYDDVYYYHPGGQLRLTMEEGSLKDYVRYTNYSTAEVGVRYTDEKGQWQRSTFTSRADGVNITEVTQSSTDEKVNMTVSFDPISLVANYGNGNESDIKYKIAVDEDNGGIYAVAHYPDYENSELKNGGFATYTKIITVGGESAKIQGSEITDDQYVGSENPQVEIKGAEGVYLISVTGRTADMGALGDFETAEEYTLVNELRSAATDCAQKYAEGDSFDYSAALKAHTDLFTPEFNAVTLDLGGEDKDNTSLIKGARGGSKIDSDLAQQAYYAGRYAYMCCAGYSTSRLYGMWTGEWNTGWGSKYTMDANVNLQTASLSTGSMPSAVLGYTYFILRQAADWEENALATHGYTDAIQAPVNTDGDCAVISETCYPYPFRYWNAGASWLLLPLYEAVETAGSREIPLSDEFDLDTLRSVLSLTDEDLTDEAIAAIREKGSLDLERDVLLPLLIKNANYWQQLMSPEYYTDSEGNIHYEQGKTALEQGEKYAILPGYSPENNPSNYPSPSTANAAVDISACRSGLEMLIDLATRLDPSWDVSGWESLKNNLPEYLYDDSGAIKEWACSQFEENNEHRHLSHLYCAWPLTETQADSALRDACVAAIENRESENEASHALVHRSLIAARLKDSAGLTEALAKLMNNKIYYDSLMTNHDYDRGSCYCTDFSLGYLGIINESLVYSERGKIEILPTLPESGFEKGTITGLGAKTQAVIEELTWDLDAKTATAKIRSLTAQTITVTCPLSGDSFTESFTEGETKTISFTLK